MIRMTQFSQAKRGSVTPEMEQVARAERVTPEYIREGIAGGSIIITRSTRHT
ncbi:MAG: phosphomethylpyrimidine synthase ThiC, partial [Candidatus Hydrogenedentota bacterium]